ncbi:hypothetical protein WICMUC_000487 [Wickerhamomyces mucosus]|uniref:Acetyl-CoA transporter n=1 Tax=Wickerhamomyces mucosus TaxID=1378264 RepID=A0A9P8PXA0_9ASCO|nr:hypothetical protein WICMUC_000487 [Wickerhamomyces mucosus]
MPDSSSIDLIPIHNRKSRSVTPNQEELDEVLLNSNKYNPLPIYSNDKNETSLPYQDRPQFILLILLYLLQGIPVGLAFGSIPFLLKSKLSYSQVAFFTLASYPYSLKLLWSPIVDALYFEKFGRRKSWIIPIQLVSGSMLIGLGSNIENLLLSPEENLSKITSVFFTLVFLCATQDIAVDGWALTILSPGSLSYASTAQTIGLNTGYFLSFTVFLAFNSLSFSNKYLRKEPLDYPSVTLSQYLTFWGFVYILLTFFVAFFVNEDPAHLRKKSRKSQDVKLENSSSLTPLQSLKNVYGTMFQVLKLSNVQQFILIHLISKIGFQANESATNLKLLEKGFAREDLAITVLIDFPFEIIFGYYVAKWSNGRNSLQPWLYAYLGRLLAAFLSVIVVYAFPASGKINSFYFIVVILQHLLGSFMSTIQFVSMNSFHTQISDPLIGGTYMTTLNTLSNLGGQWPKFIVLSLIDILSVSSCVTSTSKYNCKTEDCKSFCTAKDGGKIIFDRDGFYITNLLCITVGLVLFFSFIKKKVLHLQSLSISQWRVKDE